MRRAWRLVAPIALGILLLAHTACADQEFRLSAGPEGGVSINADQWLLGGFARLGGVCLLFCGGDFGLVLNTLGGLGGNHATVHVGLRLDRVFWFTDSHKVGIYPAIGAGGEAFIPIGRFASFCHRTDLDGCGGIRFAFEAGGGLRLWPAFLQAILATGELPALTVTAGVHFDLWESNP